MKQIVILGKATTLTLGFPGPLLEMILFSPSPRQF